VTSIPVPVGPSHAAALYDSDEDLRARVLNFLRAGLDGGEAVVAVVSQRAEKIVGSALGDDAAQIRWGLPGLSYQHLGRASEAIRGYLAGRRAAGAATRLLMEGELDGGPRGAGRMAAYLRSEAAATQLFGGYGFPWVCLYDRRRYTPEVLADAARVHPQVVGADGGATGNAEYVEPVAYLSAHPGPVSPIPPDVALEMKLTEVGDLAVARHRVGDVARVLGLTIADSRMAEVAAGEVIANAFRHGIMPGHVREWRAPAAVIVRVDSGGAGETVATAGFQPPDLARGTGAGLWVARQLADVVHVETGPDATVVELQFPPS
jgi:anti-sigma regulatory factor (Ser/Thr protein kinase)